MCIEALSSDFQRHDSFPFGAIFEWQHSIRNIPLSDREYLVELMSRLCYSFEASQIDNSRNYGNVGLETTGSRSNSSAV